MNQKKFQVPNIKGRVTTLLNVVRIKKKAEKGIEGEVFTPLLEPLNNLFPKLPTAILIAKMP